MADLAVQVIEKIEGELPADFPGIIHRQVEIGVIGRLTKLEVV